MRRTVLPVVLAVAAAARLWYLAAGVPHAVGVDEPLVADHALNILRTGDWNPHIFNYPALVIYLNAALDIVRFLFGALRGEWSSLDGFSIDAIYRTGRTAAALIGVAGVWLTYKLGRELWSRPAALLAAALMAVKPMHVRESHFILTDVPMTALVTLALWGSARAARLGTVRAYALAGAACGLAAAAKYTGGVVFVAVLAAWLVNEWRATDRGRKMGAAVGAAAVAFLAAAPYTLIDLPSFLDGFASLFSHFNGQLHATDPAWMLYAKHIWLDGAVVAALALAGVAIVLCTRDARRIWTPTLIFAAAYAYELSSHTHVFGRYVLPLLPVACVLASVAVMWLFERADLSLRWSRPSRRHALIGLATSALLYLPTATTVRWLDAYKRTDTRTIAADWLKKNAQKGSRVAVENSGPTYLDAAGFAVVPTELLFDHEVAWYRERADYLVISTGDLARYADLLSAGPTVFQISPTPQRWGPPILIVRLRP